MNNRPRPLRLISRGVRLQGNFRHIALWLGVIGLIPLSYFLKQDMGWSSENIWRIVVLPLSICIVWSLAAIGWARHGRIQMESSCPHCRYCLEGHHATVMRCPVWNRTLGRAPTTRAACGAAHNSCGLPHAWMHRIAVHCRGVSRFRGVRGVLSDLSMPLPGSIWSRLQLQFALQCAFEGSR